MAGIRDIDLSENRVITSAFRDLQKTHTAPKPNKTSVLAILPTPTAPSSNLIDVFNYDDYERELQEVMDGKRCERCGKLKMPYDLLQSNSLLCSTCDDELTEQVTGVGVNAHTKFI